MNEAFRKQLIDDLKKIDGFEDIGGISQDDNDIMNELLGFDLEEFEKGFAILETEDKEGLESNVKVAGLADIKPYVEPQIQIQPPHSPQHSPQQVPVVLNMYNVNGNENTLQPQPQVESHQSVEAESVDFSQPKIKIKD